MLIYSNAFSRALRHMRIRLYKGKLDTTYLAVSIALINNVGGIWGIYMKELHPFHDCICREQFQVSCNANPSGFQDKETVVASKVLQLAKSKLI